MLPPDAVDGGFYRTLATGETVCLLCHAQDHAHKASCAVLALDGRLRELTAQLGLFVATTRETLDDFERLLRGTSADAAGQLTRDKEPQP